MTQDIMNYILLCDAATVDNSGKLNILGIFGKVYLSTVPDKSIKFSVVINLSLVKIKESANTLEIKILDFSNKELGLNPPMKLNFNVPENDPNKNPIPEMNLILEITNLEFLHFGLHHLNVYLNDELIGSKKFEVEKGGVKS